jgi:hypothetical protein
MGKDIKRRFTDCTNSTKRYEGLKVVDHSADEYKSHSGHNESNIILTTEQKEALDNDRELICTKLRICADAYRRTDLLSLLQASVYLRSNPTQSKLEQYQKNRN